MKQIFKYAFTALFCLICLTAYADRVDISNVWNGSVTYSIDGSKVTLTVIPDEDYYITIDDILVEKTIDGGVAQAPSLGPSISAPIEVTAVNVDDRGKGTYTFQLVDGFGAFVTATFHGCIYFSPSVSLEGWTYGQTPNEPVIIGNESNGEVTITYATEDSWDYSPNVPTDVGCYRVKVSIAAKGPYMPIEETAFFCIWPARITDVVLESSELAYTGVLQTAVIKAVKAGTLDVPEAEYAVEANSGQDYGSYSITVRGNADYGQGGNFGGVITCWYTITQAPLTITAKSYTIKQGDPLPDFEAEFEGFVNGETSDVLMAQPIFYTSAASDSEPGEYEIDVYGAQAQNYDISYVKGTLTIEEAEVVEIEPVEDSEEVSFSNNMDESTDLSNSVINNTYYNMDETNGDGYDAEEGAIVMNSTTTEEQMNTVQNAEVGDDDVRDNYSGIIFEVPAGGGTVTVDAKTIGTHVLNVQIGNGMPTKVTKSERGTVDISYKVNEPTYVYLYASTEGGSAASPLRAPAAGSNSLLLYGYTVTISYIRGDANADKKVTITDAVGIVNKILGNPSTGFNEAAADVNDDKEITITDAVGVVNIILNQGGASAPPMDMKEPEVEAE